MFISFVIAFVLAVFSFYQTSQVPSLWPAIVALVLLAVNEVFRRRDFRLSKYVLIKHSIWVNSQHLTWLSNVLLGFIIGFCWVFWQTFFAVNVNESWFGREVEIQGCVVGLPVVREDGGRAHIKFSLELQRIADVESNSESLLRQADEKHAQDWRLLKPKIQLSWYLAQAQFDSLNTIPKPGEQWRFIVKLRANHASMNLGALDYEAWLYQNRIAAKGYVVQKKYTETSNLKLADSDGFDLRYRLAQRLESVFSKSELGGIYEALSYGDKHSIGDGQWQILQNTGTVHLMAISGLHMGIVAALGYWIFKALWWLGLHRIRRFNLLAVAASGALLFATVYLVLAGYAIPTQRAYLMVVAVLLFLFIKREFQPWSALFLAALMVVAWDPRSVLSLGFWLSFLAVALIFSVLQSPYMKRSPRWLQLVWIQLALTFGLAPYLLWTFHFLPSFSLLANLVAVPFVSLIGLPAVFLVAVISLFSPELAADLVPWLDRIWNPVWHYLKMLGNHENAVWSVGGVDLWQVIVLYALLFSVLLFKSIRVRGYLGVTLLVFAFGLVSNVSMSRPENGQAWVHVLDVGQGQAIVIETRRHVMVYDTGAKWGDKMDGAKLAILPFLHLHHWPEVDLVMVSHSDIDHAGGLNRLLKRIPVKRVVSGQPQKVEAMLSDTDFPIRECEAGQNWIWDDVVFQILSPGNNQIDPFLTTDNDRSCVLKISVKNGSKPTSVLISGDLSSGAEKRLVEYYGKALQADILVAGHHGSRYSSSSLWLQQVKPEVVLFSSGYRNRYQFPAQTTLQRLASGTTWYNTACSGGIGYLMGQSAEKFNPIPAYQVRKESSKWYHHSCLANEKGILFQ